MDKTDKAFVLKRISCVAIGELPSTPELEDILAFVSSKSKELDMVIQFDLADCKLPTTEPM